MIDGVFGRRTGARSPDAVNDAVSQHAGIDVPTQPIPTPSDAHDRLAEVVGVITRPLPPELRERLDSKVRNAEPRDNATALLEWVLTRDTGEPEVLDEGGWSLCIYVDWRASNAIEWQANEILTTLQMEQRWECAGVGPCPVGLMAFSNWLVPRGYALIHMDTGSDDYFAFVVPQQEADRVMCLALEAGVQVESSKAFAAHYSKSGELLF